MGFVYQLPWQSNGGYGGIAEGDHQRLADERRRRDFSGGPFTVTANGDTLNTPSNQQTADLVGEVTHVGEIGGVRHLLRSGGVAAAGGRGFGNTGRNSFRGPGSFNMDASLFRGFPIGGARRIEFRVEAINVTNTPKFGNPTSDVTSGSFMRITGITRASYPERQIRLGVRFAF